MKKKFLTTELLRDIIPVNNSRRRMSLKMEDTAICMVCGKTVCKRLLADGFYICSMHFDWPAVSEAGFYRYEYCNDIHSGCVDHFHRDRWLSLQCSRLLFKCILILLFSDGAKDVF